jgi:hypothetical protein
MISLSSSGPAGLSPLGLDLTASRAIALSFLMFKIINGADGAVFPRP